MPRPSPIVFVHGYSDRGASWAPWRAILQARLGLAPADLRTCTYVSLNNEITIKDIAEAFDRALTAQGGLDPEQKFDAIVHSTGMLVVRAWLAADPRRAARLGRLIAFAPATFGSPLAHEGRSWLGAIFKGNRHLGPDFLNAGDRVLDELELASSFSWRLAEADLTADPPRYSMGPDTPWVFVFCGTGTYGGIEKLVRKRGTDGTVRRSGCALNVRLIELDMTQRGSYARRRRPALLDKAELDSIDRVVADNWLNISIPVHLVGDGTADGLNHATILSAPPQELQDLVIRAFELTAPDAPDDQAAGYAEWLKLADAPARMAGLAEQFQQFLVHAVDERGDPVTDYNVQLFRIGADGPEDASRIQEFDADVDVYSSDRSYRCFHVDVANLLPAPGVVPPGLSIRVIASSGTTYVGYLGYGFEEQTEPGSWDASLTFDAETLARYGFFRPYTTTLIRLHIERQVLPPDRTQPSTLLVWDPASDAEEQPCPTS